MNYAEYSQRKALGMRYQQDPAYLLDKQRLEQEYSILPERARLAESKRQFNINQEAQKDAQKRSGMSSTVGTLGNLYSYKMMSDAMKPAAGVASGGMGATLAPPTTLAPTTLAPTMGAVPAASGLGVAEGSVGLGSVNVSAAPATSASSVGLGTVMGGVGMGMIGGLLGKTETGQEVGKALMFGGGGRRENAAVAGNVAGSALGALAGGISTGAASGAASLSWSGPGALVGAVVGGIVGAVSALVDSWVCTATAEETFMTESEKVKMNLLKIHAIKNHFGWWNSYLKHGTELTKAIKEQEKNLPEFYGSIRLILVEPIYKEENIEKCFQIYLAVTKMLFKAYMPSFEFKEEE